MSITHNLTDQELATVLYALRNLQDDMHNDPVDTTGEMADSGHFKGLTPPSEDEIDNLCERLNLGPEKPQRRVVVIVEHGVAEFSEVPDGIEAVLIDYDDLDCYQGEALKNAISAFPEDLQPALREYFTVEDDEPEGQDDPAHDSEPLDEPEQ